MQRNVSQYTYICNVMYRVVCVSEAYCGVMECNVYCSTVVICVTVNLILM